jgi:hypothetical protein
MIFACFERCNVDVHPSPEESRSHRFDGERLEGSMHGRCEWLQEVQNSHVVSIQSKHSPQHAATSSQNGLTFLRID